MHVRMCVHMNRVCMCGTHAGVVVRVDHDGGAAM